MTLKEQSEQIRGKGVSFDRIRRITGYLVGSVDRWNSGKKAELDDRVKHTKEGSNSEIYKQ